MKSIVKLDTPLVSPPSDFKGDFFKGMTHTLLTTDRSYFLHFCRLVVFAAHVVHTVDVAMFVVYLSVFLFFFNQLLAHMVIVFFFFFSSLFYRNSNWISRCWPHKCGGQIWHTITRQR